MQTLRRFSLLLALVSAFQMGEAHRTRTLGAEGSSSQSEYAKHATAKYDVLLKDTIGQLVAIDPNIDSFELGKPCGDRCLSIYVLDGKKIREREPADIGVRIARNNFVFVPPNALLIDEYFLLEIVLSSLSEHIAIANQMSMLKRNEGTQVGVDLATGLEINRIMAGFRQAENLRVLREEGRSPYTDEEIAAFVASVPIVASKGKGLHEGLAVALAFVMFHEFGHYKDRTSGAFDLSWNGISWLLRERVINAQSRRREESADEHAKEMLVSLVRARLAEGTPKLSIYTSAGTLAQNFRHIHYLRMFGGFRGFTARDIIYSLYHKECEEFAHANDASGSQKVRTRGIFGDFEFLTGAEERKAVLLSAREFEDVRARLMQSLTATHPYPATRGVEIINLLNREMREANGSGDLGKAAFSEELRFIEAVSSNNPGKASPDVDGVRPFPFDLEALKNEVSATSPEGPEVKVERAVNCEGSRCAIVTFSYEGEEPFGYLEVIANDKGALDVNYVTEVPMLDFLSVSRTDEEVRQRLEKRLLSALVVARLMDIETMPAMEIFSRVAMQNRACGAAGLALAEKDRTIGVSTMARAGWVRVHVRGLQDEAKGQASPE